MAQQQSGGPGRVVARLMGVALLIAASFGLVSAGPRAGVGAEEGADGADGEALVLQRPADFGDAALVAVEGLSYRDAPSLDAAVLTLLPYGTRGTLTGGPVAADGYTWWQFTLDGAAEADATPGWVAGEFLTPPAESAGGFAAGTELVVAGDDLNLRAEPTGSGAIVAALPLGMRVTISEGPIVADGYRWYRISIPAQADAGWVAGEFLVPADGAIGFALGSELVIVADGLNMRDAPTLGGLVVEQLAAGTEVLVTGGPLAADGYTWYQIAIDGPDGAGWVAGEFLSYP